MTKHKDEWKEKLEDIKKQMPASGGKVQIRASNQDKEPYKAPKKDKSEKVLDDLQSKANGEDVDVTLPSLKTLQLFDEDADTPNLEKTDDELSVDKPGFQLVEDARNGEVSFADWSTEERYVAVAYLRLNECYTQDQTAKELGITRRTVYKYDEMRKKAEATKLAKDKDPLIIGGQVYAWVLRAAEQAYKAGKPKVILEVWKMGVELLQSLGVVFRLPAQQQVQSQQQINKQVTVSGFEKFQKAVEGEEVNLQSVLNELTEAIEIGQLDEGKK